MAYEEEIKWKEFVDFMRDTNAMIDFGDRWMCLSSDFVWSVYTRPKYARTTVVLYCGNSFLSALKELKGDSE